MRRSWLPILALTLALPGTIATAAEPPPNVVLILADDLGATDLGGEGSDLHETPNLDRLGRQGVRFTRAYAMSVCSPTRAALMTGKHPARLGMTIWREGALQTRERAAPPSQKLLPPVAVADLPRDETTLAELLRDRGYRTYHVGKWHLGDAAGYPEVHGFDVNVGGTLWGAPATFLHPFRGETRAGEFRYVPGLGRGEPGDYLTDRFTDEALRLIDEAGDAPFFLNLWYHAVHTPIQGKPALVEHYRRKLDGRAGHSPPPRHRNPEYAAMVHALDENVGRVLRRLDDRGLTGRTLLIFLSDNGGYLGTYGGRRVTTNAPLRSGKGSLYEGGIRVPLYVRWPGRAREGSACDVPVTCQDLWPTVAEAVGAAEAIEATRPDGLSLVRLLGDPATGLPRDALFFHYPHYYPTTAPVGAIRAGDWKLVESFETGRVELYNLADDPGESRDLAEAEADRAAELSRRLARWRAEVGARLPTPNPTHRPADVDGAAGP